MHPRPSRLLPILIATLLLGGCSSAAAPAAPAAPRAAPTEAAPAASSASAPALATEPPRQLQKVTVPYTPISGPMAPLWIGVDQKLFEKYGLEVTAQFVGGSSPITQALTTGEYDIAVANGGVAALNRLNGGDIMIVGLHAPTFSIDSWSRPEIRSIAGLRGKSIGVTRFGSSTHFAAIAMLESAGLQPTDAVILQTGGVSESLAALLSGQMDAVMLAPPQSFEARRAGYYQVALMSEMGEYGLFPETGIIAREAVLRDPQLRAMGVNFMRAFTEALHVAKTDAEVTKQALHKYAQIDDETVLQDTFDFYSKFFPDTLRIDERSITNMMRFLDDPRARDADPKLFYDNGLVDDASR